MIAGPIPRSNRIAAVDVLRGVALLGIVVVNAAYFGRALSEVLSQELTDLPLVDGVAALCVWLFAEVKFISIFSILFGFGLAMQRQRRLEAGKGFIGFGLRRMVILALFGLVHALGFWYGDVLFLYAMVGTVVVLGLGLATPIRLAIGLAGVGLAMLMTLGLGSLEMLAPARETVPEVDPDLSGWSGLVAAGFDPSHPAWTVTEVNAYARGPFLDAFTVRALSWVMMLVVSALSFGWQVLGLVLIGTWMHDRDFFGATSRPLRRRLIWILLPLGFALTFVDGFMIWNSGKTSGPGIVAAAIHGPAAAMIGIGLIAAITELVDRARMPAAGILAAVGRMSLSAYLLETLIFTFLMQWWGLGMFGSIGRAGLVGIAIGVYAVVALTCILWTRRFGMGPMERLWRLLSYGPGSRKS